MRFYPEGYYVSLDLLVPLYALDNFCITTLCHESFFFKGSSSNFASKGLVKPIQHFIQHVECWMKVCIVCRSHPTCFIQHASPFIPSFNFKSKMATDMLLPVILPELVDSDDEKPRRGKTR